MTTSLIIQTGGRGQPRLLDHLVDAASSAEDGIGLFAWATVAGVDALLGHQEVDALCTRGTLRLIVGTDAITTEAALDRLAHYESNMAGLSIQTFINTGYGLFHPKLSVFRDSIQERIIVGSGNLTLGGVSKNYEAFVDSTMSASSQSPVYFSQVEQWLTDHVGYLSAPLSSDSIAAVQTNAASFDRVRRAEADRAPGTPIARHTPQIPDRILIAEIPKNRGSMGVAEYSQVSFDIATLQSYFGYGQASQTNLLLTHVDQNGNFGRTESRVVRSKPASSNWYFEIDATHGRAYPQSPSDRPIAVFREIGNGEYLYMAAAPGDFGYGALRAILDAQMTLAQTGRLMRRIVTDSQTLYGLWPQCPIAP